MGRHDQLFKELIRTFFAEFLPLVAARAVERLDPARSTFLDKETFTDIPKGERRELDLVALVPRRASSSSPSSAIVHVEIEAVARPGMGQRLWSYARQLRLRHFHPVLTIVVYHRGGPPGIVWETLRENQLGLELEQFTYCSWGLEKSRAEDYLARPQPVAWALAALMRSKALSRPRHKLECLRRIAAEPDLNDAQRFLLANFVETYLQLDPEDTMRYAEITHSAGNYDEFEGLDMTWGDKLEARITKQVTERLTAQATEQFRSFVLRLLTQRFGPLSETTRRRLGAFASFEDLQRLGEQIASAPSLQALGLSE